MNTHDTAKPARQNTLAGLLAMVIAAVFYSPLHVFALLMAYEGLHWHLIGDPQVTCSIDKTGCYGPRPSQVVVAALCILAGLLLTAWAGQIAGRFPCRLRNMLLLGLGSLTLAALIDALLYYVSQR